MKQYYNYMNQVPLSTHQNKELKNKRFYTKCYKTIQTLQIRSR